MMHFYPLRFGFATEGSLCDINQTFNCDSVASSQWAEIYGIPVAGLGFVFNAALFVMIMMGWLNWSEDSRKYRVIATQMSIFSCLSTVAMLFISVTSMKQYCIVCLALHALAFITLWANLKIEKLNPKDCTLTKDLGLKAGLVLGIPLVAFLVHKSYMQSYGADEVQRAIQNSILDWQIEKPKNFTAKALLTRGASAESAKMVIREFADLLCGHCKHAAPSLKAFTQSHESDVRLEFYLFPLDANCNPEMKYSSGLSCTLARILVCAEKQNMGWAVQEKIFEKQEELMSFSQPEEMQTKALALFDGTALNQQQVKECMKDPQVNALLVEQSKQGKEAGVEGTPTIFVADKKLSRGQMIPVLQRAYKSLTESKP